MYGRHQGLVVACVAAAAISPALAQPPDLCSVVPFYDFDGAAEDLLGIAPGFVGEYCQDLDLTPLLTGPNAALCTNAGLYFAVGLITGLTYHVDTPHPVFGDVNVRRAFAATFEDGINIRNDTSRGTPPSFPAFGPYDEIFFDENAAAALLEEAGWVKGEDGIRVCQGWNGSNGNQAIPADVGPGPVHDIWASFDGGQSIERVQDFPGFEDYRSVLAGLQVAPIGGSLTGDQVVPPPVVLSPDKGMLGVWEDPPGGGEYTFRLRHSLPSPSSAELRLGRFGDAGPLIQDLGPPGSPIVTSYAPPDPEEFDRLLQEGSLYVQVNSLGGSAIRTNLAFAQRRTYDWETVTVRVGLTHPGTTACYDIHHSGVGDESVSFDMVAEDLRPFTNGTLPRVDENEMPRGGETFSVEIGVSVEAGPLELFPAGFFEPGTGTPLTDGCVDFGIDDPIDATNFAVIREATLTYYLGGLPFGPPQDVTDGFSFYLDPPSGLWRAEGRTRIPNAAGQGFDSLRWEITSLDGVFGDGFRGPDTDAWSLTVGGQ